MSIRLIGLALLIAATPVGAAKPAALTIKTGETWQFSLFRGQPVHARKASADARPASGQIQVTVRSLLGTTMTIVSNNPIAFTYRAELLGTDNPVAARSCALPPDGRLSFESWPQKADAVRLSDFKVAPKGGACP
ncbi:hypothetical protein [Sphingomonas sp.]|uniref:hypothetical protein n=1 Tax=Sphingomonas sp. TaxID=28214 RepID=UPI0025F4682A|nr:hypothetical protein [Sphingomonas sp.]